MPNYFLIFNHPFRNNFTQTRQQPIYYIILLHFLHCYDPFIATEFLVFLFVILCYPAHILADLKRDGFDDLSLLMKLSFCIEIHIIQIETDILSNVPTILSNLEQEIQVL